jgi:hypothetical protein
MLLGPRLLLLLLLLLLLDLWSGRGTPPTGHQAQHQGVSVCLPSKWQPGAFLVAQSQPLGHIGHCTTPHHPSSARQCVHTKAQIQTTVTQS